MIRAIWYLFKSRFIELAQKEESPEQVWSRLAPQLKAFYRSDENTPITHKHLSYRFSDSKGMKYYGFPDNMSLPISRMGKLMNLQVYLYGNITQEQLSSACQKINELLMQSVVPETNTAKRSDAAAKVTAIVEDVRSRNEMILQTDLFFNYLAAIYIREDEDPQTFNQAIHNEKINTLKGEDGLHSFFFHSPELKSLFGLLHLSEKDWSTFYNESQMAQEQIRLRSELINSF